MSARERACMLACASVHLWACVGSCAHVHALKSARVHVRAYVCSRVRVNEID